MDTYIIKVKKGHFATDGLMNLKLPHKHTKLTDRKVKDVCT